jgi:4-carboxymuconolactone decarboxylase
VARLDTLPVEQLSPEQKALHDKIRGNRPKLGGPFGVWLRTPALAGAASSVVEALRENGRLEKRLYELIVLTVVRHWSAQYAWAVHEPIARAAGFSDETIEALRAKRKPVFSKPDEALARCSARQPMSACSSSSASTPPSS